MSGDPPSVPTKPTVSRRRFRITRDGILFVVGLAGIIYETFANHGENTSLLIVFAAMCGLPAFLMADERFTRRAPPEEKSEESP